MEITDKNVREIIDKSYDAGRDATINKAVDWFKDNWREYIFHDADGMTGFIGWEKDFSKAMKRSRVMNFTSQICTTKEQSERLIALGLKRETADCVIMYYDGWHIGIAEDFDLDKDPVKPTWSLHRLLCLLPREYIYDIDFQRIMQDFVFGSKDMYDEVISCIEILIEEGYFYEEYLEERL